MNFINQMKADAATDTVFIHLLDKFKTPRHEWKKTYRPSTIAFGYCPHLWGLLALGYVKGFGKTPALLQRVFDNGHGVHDRYHRYTNELDAVYKDERYGDPENEFRCAERTLETNHIKGRYDCILDGRKLERVGDNNLYVTDFKSINHDKFRMLVEPLDYHYNQLIIYLGMVSDLYELDRPVQGLYIYESKNTQEVKEFVVPWDDEAKESYENLKYYINLTEAAIEEGDVSGLPCFCTRKDKCGDWDIEELKRHPKRIDM